MAQGLQQDEADYNHCEDDVTVTRDDCAAVVSQSECLSYLNHMVAELGTIASKAGLDRLATILQLAKDEADQQLLKLGPATVGNPLNPGP